MFVKISFLILVDDEKQATEICTQKQKKEIKIIFRILMKVKMNQTQIFNYANFSKKIEFQLFFETFKKVLMN